MLAEMQTEQLEPATVAVNTAMRACERGSAWEEALCIFQGASRSGSPRLDVISFSTAVAACARGIRWADALQLLSELLQEEKCNLAARAPRRRSEDTPGFQGRQVDMVLYNATVAACEKAAVWAWAMHLLRSTHDVRLSPDLVTYNSTLSSLARGRRWSMALELCSDMDRSQTSPVPWRRKLDNVPEASDELVSLQILQVLTWIGRWGLRLRLPVCRAGHDFVQRLHHSLRRGCVGPCTSFARSDGWQAAVGKNSFHLYKRIIQANAPLCCVSDYLSL